MENITKEVMENTVDEVIFVAEEIVPKTNKGLKIAGGAAAVLAAGYGIYKVAKWIGGKIKAKKEKEQSTEDTEPTEQDFED